MALKGKKLGGHPGNAISQKTSDRKIATAKRRQFVMQARLQGATFSRIAFNIKEWAKKEGIELPKNYDELQACQDILREIEKLHKNNAKMAQRILDMELERLDNMQFGIYQDAVKGDVIRIDRMIKIMDRRARYLGLDAPIKGEITGAEGEPVRVIFELPDNGRRAKGN